MSKTLIVFVGPQAIGKTTQAKLLELRLKSEGYERVFTTELSDHNLIYSKFVNLLLKTICKNKRSKMSFYANRAPIEILDVEVHKRIFVIVEVVYAIGLILSMLKQKLLMSYFNIVIEHDSHIFKLLADLWFMARRLDIEKQTFSSKLLDKITAFSILTLLKNDLIILMLHLDYESIGARCLARGSPIEPVSYVNFQYYLYNYLATMISNSVLTYNINMKNTINAVHSEIYDLIKQGIL